MKNDNNNVLNNDELFELIWPGKKDAISLANTPSSKNLILDTLDLVVGDDLIVFSSVTKLGVKEVHQKLEELSGEEETI